MPTSTAPATDRQTGMGAIPHEQGVAFRVWAPHASQVLVVGSFNDWNDSRNPLQQEGNGYWYADVAEAQIGDEYRYLIINGDQKLSKIDPYAREVTNSVGNGVVHNPVFDWQEDDFQLPPWNEIAIYELHIGTFNDSESGQPGTFQDAINKLGYLKRLGINVIQVMPAAEFAGDYSWGYNPAHIFAVESAYGGPNAFKEFVREAHKQGLGVVLDVVYNHFGPSDLDLWQFDGWSENNMGGIYFYNDWRSETPWGNTRPDYGRGEVRQFIRDNALSWLEDFHVDGLRFDMTLYIRSVRPGDDIPEGWTLAQWINSEVSRRFPGRITIAEDLQHNNWLTKAVEWGGAGFGSQWDSQFVHPIRETVITPNDDERSMPVVRDAIYFNYNGDPFQRVVYSESHDEVANGKARVPQEINPDEPESYFSQKRSTLAAGLVCTVPGIPMLFQGQEFLEGGWFRDTVPLDWDQRDDFCGIVRMYRDLLSWRLNRKGVTRGLCGRGVQVHHLNDQDKLIAFHRWDVGGPGDDVIVVANFSSIPRESITIGFPAEGTWKLRLNSAWTGYSKIFTNYPSHDVQAHRAECDGQPCSGEFGVGPYTLLIYSQDPQ